MDKKKGSKCFKISKTVLILSILILAIICRSSRDISEWLAYNLFYTPLYSILGSYLYGPFIIQLLSLFLPLTFLTLGLVYLRSFLPKNKKYTLKISQIAIIVTILILSFFIFKNSILDMKFIIEKKYLTEESYLYKFYRSYNRSSRKKISNPYYYRFDTNTIKNKNIQTTITINNKTRVEYDYEYLNLNVYQYKKLLKIKKTYINEYNADSIPIKIYYLPNTKMILKYEIRN